jgi:hypothetical protein
LLSFKKEIDSYLVRLESGHGFRADSDDSVGKAKGDKAMDCDEARGKLSELKRLVCSVNYDVKGGQSHRVTGKGRGGKCSL